MLTLILRPRQASHAPLTWMFLGGTLVREADAAWRAAWRAAFPASGGPAGKMRRSGCCGESWDMDGGGCSSPAEGAATAGGARVSSTPDAIFLPPLVGC